MNTILILFTIAFVVLLLLYLNSASKRKTLKNIFCLITNIITFIEAILLSRLFVNVLSNNISNKLGEFIKDILKITKEEWIRSTSIDDISILLSTIIVSIISFIISFVIVFLINHLLKRVIFKKTIKESYSNYETKGKDNRIVNALIGLASFTVVSFAFLFPVGALSYITNKSLKEVNFKTPDVVEPILSNPVIKVYESGISKSLFDKVTNLKDNPNKIKTSRELEGLLKIAFSALDIVDKKDVDKKVVIIKNELSSTYLVPNFVSELCSNAATRFKNNQTFMGQSLEIPNNNTRIIYLDLLDIISNWKRENLNSDINTIFNLYYLLEKYNIKKLDDPNLLIDAFTKEEFTEELFLEVFHNNDFKELMPTFINFGIKTIFDEVKINSDVEYVNTMDLHNMNDEDIKKEARLFSLTIRQIKELESLKGKDLTQDEFIKIMNNLNQIKDSRILNDVLYNLLYKLLQKQS